MPPLKPRHIIPVPEPTAPSAGGRSEPTESLAACQRLPDVVLGHLHPAHVVEPGVVALAHDRDDHVVTDSLAPPPA